MSNLVERLREQRPNGEPISIARLMDEAADRIAALEAEVMMLRRQTEPMVDPEINWLVHQLEAWPHRVDKNMTTNITYLMQQAAKVIRGNRLAQQEGV